MDDSKKDLQGEFILGNAAPTPPPAPVEAPIAPVEPPVVSETKAQSPLHAVVKKRPHFFSSWVHHPDGFTFQNQKDGEEVILLVRRAFITNLPWILSAVFFAFAGILIFPFATLLFPSFIVSPQTQTITLAFYYLMVFGFVLLNFTLWYFHIGIVTNERIVDVDIHGILIRNVAETKIELVQDVSYTQAGVIRSIFNYGDVHIQTAGNNLNFEFDKAPTPGTIVRIIGELIQGEK